MAQSKASSLPKLTPEQHEACKTLTPRARLSYPHLDEPSAMANTTNEPKYSASFLIPKELKSDKDKKAWQGVLKAVKNAKIFAFGDDETKWPKPTTLRGQDQPPKTIQSPFKSGEKVVDAEGETREGYEGQWVIAASSKESDAPAVFDKDKSTIENDDINSILYAGCYVAGAIKAYVWEFPAGSKKYGVGFNLNAVMKLGEGEPFGAKRVGSEAFANIEADEEDESSSDEISDEEVDENNIPF